VHEAGPSRVTGDGTTDPRSARPIVLGPNQPPRPYRGGAGIAALRGVPVGPPDRPEDFVGSTTAVRGSDRIGLTVLDDGATLADHVTADPVGFLGKRHIETYGSDVGLLVKLLDPGQRLFVHCHPDAAFASEHLDCRHGKSEAWIVTAAPEDAAVYLGFRADVTAEKVAAWVDRQQVPEMLDALNRIAVRPGDTFFVPAGIPHAIGAGVTAVELQEPTDFSILMEWEGFDVPADDRHLGLGFDTALRALDRTGWSGERLAELRTTRPSPQAGVVRLFPATADPFFRAEHVTVDGGRIDFEAGFTILVVLDGPGELVTAAAVTPLTRGATVLVPHGAGDHRLRGTVEVLRCRPPAP